MYYYLVYLSSATVKMEDRDLQRLLKKSRKNNELIGVTGLLMYIDGNFIQVIEGEKDTVMNLYRKIARDSRHANIIKLLDGYAASRNFEEWSMALKIFKRAEVFQALGAKNLSTDAALRDMLTTKKHPIFTLLNTFYQANYSHRFQLKF